MGLSHSLTYLSALSLLTCPLLAQTKPAPVKITAQIVKHLPRRETLVYVLSGTGPVESDDIILLQLPEGHEILTKPKDHTFSANAIARGETSRSGTMYLVYKLTEPKAFRKPTITNRAQMEAEVARLTVENKRLAVENKKFAETVKVLLTHNNALLAKVADLEGEAAKHLVSPSSKPKANNVKVEILWLDWKIIARGSCFVRYSWKMTLANHTDSAISVSGEIDFIDKTGFEVDYESFFDLIVPAKNAKTFTGIVLVDVEIAKQITSANVSIE